MTRCSPSKEVLNLAIATTRKPAPRAKGGAPRRAPARRPPPAAAGIGANGTAPGSGKARNLVIVESPTKARTVSTILGDDYRVIASVGHVRDLPPYGYGVENIDQMDFTPKYVVVKD